MALREQTLTVRWSGGINTKADEKTVPSVQLLDLQNGVFTKALSISKRNGYEALSQSVLGSPTPYAKERGIAARGSDLVLFAEGTSYAFIEAASQWSSILGGVMSVKQTDRALVKTVSNQTGCDYASSSGIAAVAWEDSRGGVWYSVVETDGGRVIVSPTQASSTGSRPRCVRCESKLMVLWAEATLGQIKIIIVDPGTPHSPSAASVLVDGMVTTLPNFDAAFVDEESEWERAAACIAWNATDGIHVAWLDPSGVIGSPGTGWNGAHTFTPADTVTAGPVVGPSRGVFASSAWAVSWATASNVYVAVTAGLNDDPPKPPLSVVLEPVEISVAGADRLAVALRDGRNPGTIDVWIEDRAATVRNSVVYHRKVNASTGAASSGSPDQFRGTCLASSAWVHFPEEFDSDAGDVQRSFVTLLHPTPLNSVYLTIRDDGLCVARSIPGNAGDPPGHQLPRVAGDDRVYEWCAVYKNKLDALNRDVFTESGPRLVTLDFNASDAFQTAYVGRSLYLGGANPMIYDGVSWVEFGFHYAPDWESGASLHTNSTSGTGGLTSGTRNYVCWYEATLATGEIIRGPTSKPYTVEITNPDDRVTLTVPTLRLSQWGREGNARENVRVCVARTINGDSSLYYRITSLDPSTEGDPNGYVENDQFSDTVEVIDELSDDDLLTKEPLYTTGNIPPNDPIPGSHVIAEAKGRIWMADPSDDSAVYFSQELADGYAVEMTPELRVVAPPHGGAITAIGQIDAAVILFKRSAIYGVSGEGPLPDPSQGGFSNPTLITADVGCIDQRTVVTTPVGLMFKSAKGIYLLDRGLQASYIGAPVEAFNDLTITRATLVDDTTQVRFLTSDGVCLVYDYLFGQWSTFTNHSGTAAAIVDGAYHYLRTDGRVFKETPGVHLDDNQQIRLRIDTAWLHMVEHLQGFQHLWYLHVLGERRSAHDLRISYRVDYEDQWLGPFTLDSQSAGGTTYGEGTYGSGVYSGTPAGAYQWHAHLGISNEAIQFRFEDAEDVGQAGAAFILTEMMLTGGVKGRVYRPFPASRST